jgi:hypothetical protein
MENEELAALRATLLAAERQPLATRARLARLSALVADGDELLPYVMAASCSDPRDRVVDRSELAQLKVLEGAVEGRHLKAARGRYEPLPTRPSYLATALAIVIVICLVAQLLGMVLVPLR